MVFVEEFLLVTALSFAWFDDCDCEAFTEGGDAAALARSFVEPSCASGVEYIVLPPLTILLSSFSPGGESHN